MTSYERTYSLVDISEKIGRPRTTLADWARQFGEFLPTIGSGRTTRYKTAALEVFALIDKMKQANEPPELIRDQLRSEFRQITVIDTENDDGLPYLAQLSGEVDDLKKAVIMLAEQLSVMQTTNDETRRQVTESTELLTKRIDSVASNLNTEMEKSRYEVAASSEKIETRISDVTVTVKDEIQGVSRELAEEFRKSQEETRTQISDMQSRLETYGERRKWWQWSRS